MLSMLESKTVVGLILILLVSCVMSSLGKLTPELVDIIKWIGVAYMGVRGVVNAGEQVSNIKKGDGNGSGESS